MTVTFDRAAIQAHWVGEEGITTIDNDEEVHCWMNLTYIVADSPAAVLQDLCSDLNARNLDFDVEYHVGARGGVSIGAPGLEMVWFRSGTWGKAPMEYLDAFCDGLSARGWQGRLTIHEPVDRPWLPYGPEPTITTMLGYGLAANEARPERPLHGWQQHRDLRASLVDLALTWLDEARGELMYSSGVDWSPTRDEARRVLKSDLSRPASRKVELGRITRSESNHEPSRGASRVGRTALFDRGRITLTENDPSRSLAARLRDHREVLLGRSEGANFGLTTGTIGHGRASESVYLHRPALRDPDANAPYRRLDPDVGLPDAYYAQLLPTPVLGTLEDSARWRRDDLPSGLTVLTATDAQAWFQVFSMPTKQGLLWVHDADTATLSAARRSLRATA